MVLKPERFKTLSIAGFTALFFSLTCAGVYAHPHPPEDHPDVPDYPAHADLASEATNPAAPLMSFRAQYQNSPSSYNADGYSQAVIGQAVIPVPLDSKAVPLLITRTTIPYLSTPDFGEPVNRKHGFGDTALLTFFIPDFGLKGHTLGFGATASIPTGGDNEYTGSGQWELGPTFVYVNTKTKNLQWGLFTFQNWDVASTRSDAADVSKISLQPILTKHFSKGWYVSTPDLPQVYDWKTNEWSLNLGAVVGRVFPWKKQHLQMFGGVYYNSEDNDDIVASEWTMKFNVSFLLPE
jgi:hypothetical protein